MREPSEGSEPVPVAREERNCCGAGPMIELWSGRKLLDDVKQHAELFTAGDFERMLDELRRIAEDER